MITDDPALPIEEPVRILSDLHFGHPASILERPEQLLPLLRGVKTVIFNGDTVELRYLRGRQLGQHHAEIIRQTCEGAGVRPIFVAGNHDPIISHVSHVDLAEGAVLATHGDLMFHDISPWSSGASEMGRAHTRELAMLGEDKLYDFELRLKASKRAAQAIEMHRTRLDRDRLATVRTLLRECWPPWRPLQILHAWVITPRLAANLARTFRPRARIVLIGHTHFSGCWQRGGRTIINTGSFLPFGGRMAVDLEGRQLSVRGIRFDGRVFHPGEAMMKFDATLLPAHQP